MALGTTQNLRYQEETENTSRLVMEPQESVGMKKVLVAGATGYLGQFVVKALKAKGHWVRALGRGADKSQRAVFDEWQKRILL